MSSESLKKNFQLSGRIYKLDEYKELFDDFKLYKYRKLQYYNVACAFDIESTSYTNGDEKCGIMYAWVLGINGKCIIGRTWDEFSYLLIKISEHYELSNEKRMIFYVHNLSFDFQFIRKRFTFTDVFSNSERSPIFAVTNLGIEFRCSYLLSGYSLENLGKNLHNYPVKKMVGDLDYSLYRHSNTPLTEKELGYILNDALVVMSYIQESIETYGNITKLALTKTGYVRKLCKKKCYYSETSHKHYDKQYKYYSDLMKSLTITSTLEYQQMKQAFAGGFTHADSLSVNVTQNDVASYDFTSSYPYVIVSEMFPMARGRLREIKSLDQMRDYMKNYCCLFTIAFEKIESSIRYEHYISYSKCEKTLNAIVDNGRVVSADYLILTITNVDFEIIEKCYKWDNIYIKKFRTYSKTYLPTPFIKAVVELYQKKTTLKDVEGEEINYMLSKENLNSCYGMMVTNIVRDEIKYDNMNDSWYIEKADEIESLNKYNNSKNRFLFYLWGVFVTAYARRNLWTGIFEFKEDYIYSDTDSIKCINYTAHQKYIDDYNNEVVNKLTNACKYHKIDFECVSPKNIKGVEKTLGKWHFEGVYDMFKTLGAKRYIYYMDNELHITISGVRKKSGEKYLMYKYHNDIDKVFNAFDDGLIFPKEYNCDGELLSATGKNTHTYIDDEHQGYIKDYLGNVSEFDELSSVHLEGADYSLSLASDFIDYLFNIKEVIM